jgi:hypothetical protein
MEEDVTGAIGGLPIVRICQPAKRPWNHWAVRCSVGSATHIPLDSIIRPRVDSRLGGCLTPDCNHLLDSIQAPIGECYIRLEIALERISLLE